MLKKFLSGLRDLLLKNIPLKLLSLIITLGIWMVVVNIEDPEQTRSYTCPVNVTGVELLTENNQYYEPIGDTDVTFRVSAPRSILDKLSTADFSATANISKLRENGTIPIEISVSRYSNSISFVSKDQFFYVEVGNLQTEQYVIEAGATGELAVGCVEGDITVDPTVAIVTGPDKIVSRIKKVVAEVDVTGKNSAVTANTLLRYLDESGLPIDTTKLTLGVTSVAVNVDVLSTKTLPINITTSGDLSEGLLLRDITADKTEIRVKGNSSLLNETTAITIPETVIDLSEITGSMTTTVDITPYLPSGATLLDTKDTQLEISIDIAIEDEREFQISTENITPRNVPEGLKVTFAKAYFNASIGGEESNLESLNGETLKGYVDCSSLEVGNYNLEVELELADEFEVTEPAFVAVHVQEVKR